MPRHLLVSNCCKCLYVLVNCNYVLVNCCSKSMYCLLCLFYIKALFLLNRTPGPPCFPRVYPRHPGESVPDPPKTCILDTALAALTYLCPRGYWSREPDKFRKKTNFMFWAYNIVSEELRVWYHFVFCPLIAFCFVLSESLPNNWIVHVNQ